MCKMRMMAVASRMWGEVCDLNTYLTRSTKNIDSHLDSRHEQRFDQRTHVLRSVTD